MKIYSAIIMTVILVSSLCLFSCKEGDGEITTTSSASPEIILFRSDLSSNGNLGGSRPAIDAMCASSLQKPADFTNVVALISIDADDEIRDIPSNFGVPASAALKSNSGNLVFNSWADMLDGSDLTISLAGAAVLPPATGWWSGSTPNGALSINCTNWNASSSIISGSYGTSGMPSLEWIDASSEQMCNFTHYVLCIAF